MNNLHKKFSQIYDKNLNSIYRFIYFKVNSEELAQDLCSETFVKAWQAFNRDNQYFRKEIKNPRAFLYQIARNLVIDYYKQKDRTRTLPLEETVLTDENLNLEKKIELDSDVRNVMFALKDLRQEQQDIIIWHYIEGLSCREIAKIINKSYGATRVMLHRSLASLKDRVEEV